jgi:hypothetical protein
MLEDLGYDGKLKNNLSFKETDLLIYRLFMFRQEVVQLSRDYDVIISPWSHFVWIAPLIHHFQRTQSRDKPNVRDSAVVVHSSGYVNCKCVICDCAYHTGLDIHVFQICICCECNHTTITQNRRKLITLQLHCAIGNYCPSVSLNIRQTLSASPLTDIGCVPWVVDEGSHQKL